MAIGGAQTDARNNFGVSSFLQSDHSLGVAAIDRLVEQNAIHRARRVGNQDRPRPSRVGGWFASARPTDGISPCIERAA
jgi:hypothetical protein